jgi:acyl-coenzyme A thioesterase PaaI-like protein
LELGVDIRFLKPAHLGDVLDLEAVVKQRLESRRVVVLDFAFRRNSTLIASGVITAMICEL